MPYLTQIGMFVPAERAVVGLVDRLFTRIASMESTAPPDGAAAPASSHSSFAADLHQIGRMLHHASPRSLLLIDEFGKGTSSVGESRCGD
jgi:DNA mismatch repair ATPase MutS